ncbi:hypothetical protein MNEG_14610 [Monoraphidium neglectum]|uniref:Uncharacterized protein n=1 Tax=Monoraphidium neglectum TaxID=145388 RepID=A0A0D2KBR7_9CHLO|nr:hypothetical protein MNEG_14610 [Monoraphidium neglectum]KIY93353.1 hypothetical protein MNEG_14610 [Monoraphidium neglectum]|eukprot:XP_013892373.1 hypothetical protein MNEG_14610 [Monoraphidium neglectum]
MSPAARAEAERRRGEAAAAAAAAFVVAAAAAAAAEGERGQGAEADDASSDSTLWVNIREDPYDDRWDLAQGCGDDGEGFGDGCGGGDGDGDECYEDAMAVMPVLSAGLSGDYGARV